MIESLRELVSKFEGVKKEEKEIQTSEDFKIIFSPHNADTGDTISSVHLEGDDTISRKKSRMMVKT